jgi:hypothetical protein
MLQNKHSISINASPEKIFNLIETMPNKFPVYKVFETKPFFFIRMLFTDGLSSAIKVMNIDETVDSAVLNIGDSIGPFRLTEIKRPLKYWFTVESIFLNCRTGYSLSSNGKMTKLNFDIIAGDLKLKEKVYWFFVKPIHHLLSNKVLRVIKEKAESL